MTLRAKEKCERGFPTMNDIKIYTRNPLENILLHLMRIVMDGDQHEFDDEKLGEDIAAEIWHYKKPWGMLDSLKANIF